MRLISRSSWRARLKAAQRAWRTGDKVKVWVTTPSGAKRITVVPFKFGGKTWYAIKHDTAVVCCWRLVYKTKIAALKATKRNLEQGMGWLNKRAASLATRYSKVCAAIEAVV